MKKEDVNFKILETIISSIAIENEWTVTIFKKKSEMYYMRFSVGWLPDNKEFITAPFKWYFGTIEIQRGCVSFNCHMKQSDFDHFEDYYLKKVAP